MIDKAVIPLAGRGTRMQSVGGGVPKGLLPLPGGDGRARAVFHWILLEAASAGVSSAGVVVSPDGAEGFERYLAGLSPTDRSALPRVQWIVQPAPAGLGDAVARAEPFTGDEPFLLMLGDHIHAAPPGRPSCAAQVVRAFAACHPAAMIGVHEIGADDLPRMGVCRGERLAHEGVYRCTAFVEKPSQAVAQRDLLTPGLPAGRFLAHAGLYAFTSEIFRHLSRVSPAGGELELAAAQASLLAERPGDYLLALVAGRVHDVGNPAGYHAACQALGC